MKRHHRAMLLPWTNKVNYTQIVQNTASANLLAYWIMGEASGTTALDSSGHSRTGTYTAVTLGQPGIGDGQTAPSFDGSTSYNTVFSASLAAAFSGAEGTIALWLMVSGSGVWSDGALRRGIYLYQDANNGVFLQKATGANTLTVGRLGGGTLKSVGITLSVTTWFHLALTWSEAAGQVKAYVNGAQSGSTQTSIGTYSGTLTSGRIGANPNSATEFWSGFLAHAAVWSTPLSATQIAALASVP